MLTKVGYNGEKVKYDAIFRAIRLFCLGKAYVAVVEWQTDHVLLAALLLLSTPILHVLLS